jgi:DNA-binding NtrC family response regulator
MDTSERSSGLPRILVIDDFFGRQVAGGTNRDRVALCEKFGIRDLSSRGAVPTPLLERPCAEAEFFRGQVPDPARPGDSVRNDLETSVRLALEGWRDGKGLRRPWAAVVLDLMFFTGRVTAESDRRSSGMPEGRPVDDSPEGYFGIEILRGLRARDPDLPVMILSSKSRGEVSRTFSELGASGFIERDAVDGPETFRSMLARHGLVPDREILGASRPLLAQLRRARLLAEGGGSVLIRGEPGTGKELLARFIHRSSPRANGPFEARSLASIPRDLAESELFGHAKGAFTGAAVDRAGAFERASGGSLLLDEVGDASPELQAKLLRVLESGSLQRVGSDAVRTVDVRVISATNIDIESRAARGEGFREDLLARLRQAGTVTMPPLRERTDDIGELAEHFVRQAERTHGRAMRRTILPETIELLGRQSWPGNIRELRNCLSQAVYQHPDVEFLAPAHVQGVLATDAAMAREIPVPEGTAGSVGSGFHQVLAAMREFAPDDERIAEWTGSLPEAQAAWSRFAAGLVLAAIRRTKRATVERPDGEVLIHPAMKLLSGNPRLTATQAADLVKRLLAGGPTGEPVPPIDEPDLREALEIAQRLRPGGGRKGAE